MMIWCSVTVSYVCCPSWRWWRVWVWFCSFQTSNLSATEVEVCFSSFLSGKFSKTTRGIFINLILTFNPSKINTSISSCMNCIKIFMIWWWTTSRWKKREEWEQEAQKDRKEQIRPGIATWWVQAKKYSKATSFQRRKKVCMETVAPKRRWNLHLVMASCK